MSDRMWVQINIPKAHAPTVFKIYFKIEADPPKKRESRGRQQTGMTALNP